MAMADRNTKTKGKIGIFCGYYLPHLGGVERYVDKLSWALMRLGYEVVIVTSNHDNLPSTETIEGRKVYRLPIRDLAKNRYPIPRLDAEYKKLIKDIEHENVDTYLLNTRFHLTSLVGGRMGRRMARPVMLIDHGTGHFTVNNRWLDYVGKLYEHGLTWLIKRYVDRYYGVSEACNTWLKHFSIRASGVFYNAINVVDKKSVKNLYANSYDKDTVVITYAGRLIKEKGILNLIEAFASAEKQFPKHKLKLAIAGDGPLFKSIKRDHKDSSIDVLGKLDFAHMMALFKRTDIFVNPSLYPEGLPTTTLEAGLMGCAVIATPRGGTTEVITDGQHGIITDGSAEELSGAIVRLLANPDERKSLADALSRRVEDAFNWDVVAKAVDKEINSLKIG
jgi:glycosyltransferase involved in cell wall biosynthesis